ncbi:MAG: three-Cys-motif partner protein TcmP [Nitrososphaerales archaeon]
MNRWLPILGKRSQSMNYIDAFAGPGVYQGGQPGSPVIALETARDHVMRPKGSVNFLFIEKDAQRALILRDQLGARFPPGSLPPTWVYEVEVGEFASVLERGLDEIEARGNQLAPTLAFLDPFGFSGWDLPMRTIARVLKAPRCEVFVTFMAWFASRFPEIVPPATLDRLFGDDSWKGVIRLRGEHRTDFLLDRYESNLKSVAGAKFTRSFEMRSSDGRVLYDLVFATKHLKGLEAMKEAMWEIDPRGSYTFSDRTDSHQKFLVEFGKGSEPHWVPAAAEKVFSRFNGEKISREAAHEFIVASTPFPDRASLFRRLEREGRLSVSGRAKRLTYPEGCELTFHSPV